MRDWAEVAQFRAIEGRATQSVGSPAIVGNVARRCGDCTWRLIAETRTHYATRVRCVYGLVSLTTLMFLICSFPGQMRLPCALRLDVPTPSRRPRRDEPGTPPTESVLRSSTAPTPHLGHQRLSTPFGGRAFRPREIAATASYPMPPNDDAPPKWAGRVDVPRT